MATVERDRARDCLSDCGPCDVCQWNVRIDISLRDGKLLIKSLTVRLTGLLPFPLRWSESLKSTEELHRVQTRGSKTALLYVGERNAHMTGCERFIKAVYTPNKVLPPDDNASKISQGGRRGREVTAGERLGCRCKVTPTHLRKRRAILRGQLGLDESQCIHHRGYGNIPDIMGLVWKRMNQRDGERNDLG